MIISAAYPEISEKSLSPMSRMAEKLRVGQACPDATAMP
jgi:hypothetical protein